MPFFPALALAAVVAPSSPPVWPDACVAEAQRVRADVRCVLVLTLARNPDLLDQKFAVDSGARQVTVQRRAFGVKVYPGLALDTFEGEDAGTGGGRAGVNVTKRMTTGTEVSVEPYFERQSGYRAEGVLGSLRQPVLRGISATYNRSALDGAIFQLRSQLRAQEQTTTATLLSAVGELLRLWRLDETRRVLSDSLAGLEKRVGITEARERVGLATTLDLFRVKIERTSVKDQLDAAQEDAATARDRLRYLLSLDPSVDIVPLVSAADDLVDPSLRGIATDPEGQRAEVRQAVDALAEARRGARVARHALLPDLSLELGFEYRDVRSSLGGFDAGPDTRWMLSLRSSGDLTRDSERATFADSVDQVSVAERSLERTRQRVRDEIRAAFRSLERSRKQEGNQKEQILQASAKLAVAESKFENGLADNFDVLQAEGELRTARLSLLQARTDAVLGMHQVMAAAGLYLNWIEETLGVSASLPGTPGPPAGVKP